MGVSDGCVSLCICMYVRMWFLYTYWCSSVCTYVRMYGIHAVKKVNVLRLLYWHEYGRTTATAMGVSQLEPRAYCCYKYRRII